MQIPLVLKSSKSTTQPLPVPVFFVARAVVCECREAVRGRPESPRTNKSVVSAIAKESLCYEKLSTRMTILAAEVKLRRFP